MLCQVTFEKRKILLSIGWVASMNLGFVLIILSFLHRLVMLPVPMEPLSMPPMSQIFPILHVDSMLPMFIHHFPYTLIQRKSSMSHPFLSYLEFACQPFPIQLLVRAHLVCLISSILSSIAEYLMLVDEGFPNSLLPTDSIPFNSDHLFWNRSLESI